MRQQVVNHVGLSLSMLLHAPDIARIIADVVRWPRVRRPHVSGGSEGNAADRSTLTYCFVHVIKPPLNVLLFL
jgi:hypothetical protein